MAIVSSSYVMDSHTQADGTRWVRETHTDSEGREQYATYKLPAGQGDTEAQARMTDRVSYLDEQLAIHEAEAILGA